MNAPVSQYTGLLTSEYNQQPLALATLTALVQGFADASAVSQLLQTSFDLDTAVGQQLDFIGQWLGQGRNVNLPLPNVYFSYDTPNLGFDQGLWFGPGAQTSGIFSLPDQQYRFLLKARACINAWDGSVPGAYALWNLMFQGAPPSLVLVDNGNLTMQQGLVGTTVDQITTALLQGGYLDFRPAGVLINNYFTSTGTGPIFALDEPLSSAFGGLDQSVWATSTGPGPAPTVPAPLLSYDFSAQTLNPVQGSSPLQLARSMAANYTGSNGLLQSAAANAPRFDFDPVYKNIKGLLVENAGTNQLQYSQAMTSGPWSGAGVIITANQPGAPDGTATANTVVFDQPGQVYVNQNKNLDASQAYSFSIWARSLSSPLNISLGLSDITTKFVTSPTITLTRNWQRFAFSIPAGTLNNTGELAVLVLGSNGQTIQLWGAQLEVFSVAPYAYGPSSYVMTTTAPASRSADNATVAVANQAYGTLFFDGYMPQQVDANTQCLLCLHDGTTNNRIAVYVVNTGSGSIYFNLYSNAGGLSRGYAASQVVPYGSRVQLALAFTPAGLTFVVNGGVPWSVTFATPGAPNINTFQVGGDSTLANNLNSQVLRASLYSQALTVGQMQTITPQ